MVFGKKYRYFFENRVEKKKSISYFFSNTTFCWEKQYCSEAFFESGKSFDDLKTKRNDIAFENENLTLLAKLDSTPLSYNTGSKKDELKRKEKNMSEMIEKNDFLIETKDEKISKNRSSFATSIFDVQKERDLWKPMGQTESSNFSDKIEKQTVKLQLFCFYTR